MRHCCPLNDRVEFELISYSSLELEAKVFGMSKDVKKMPVFELQGGEVGGLCNQKIFLDPFKIDQDLTFHRGTSGKLNQWVTPTLPPPGDFAPTPPEVQKSPIFGISCFSSQNSIL